MTTKYIIRVNEFDVLMYSKLKNYKEGIIIKQFKEIAFWIPTIRDYMDSKGNSLNITVSLVENNLNQSDIPGEYYYRNNEKPERILIEYGTKDEIRHRVLIHSSIKTRHKSPWFLIDDKGNYCHCDTLGEEIIECKVHHMGIEGHQLICGCNGRANWGLQEPLDVEVLPSFVPVNQQPSLGMKFKAQTKFRVLEFEAKPVKRKSKK